MMMISQGYFKQQQKFHDKDTNTCNPLFGFIYISTMAIYVHLYVICTGAASGDHIIACIEFGLSRRVDKKIK